MKNFFRTNFFRQNKTFPIAVVCDVTAAVVVGGGIFVAVGIVGGIVVCVVTVGVVAVGVVAVGVVEATAVIGVVAVGTIGELNNTATQFGRNCHYTHYF